jgi:high-affinity Fe2+/Pb2+ permease
VIFNPGQPDQISSMHSRVAEVHRTAVILVSALIASVAIYTAIGLFLIRSGQQQSGSQQTRMTVIVIAVMLALGSIALRRTQMNWSKLQGVANLRGVEGLIKHLFSVTLISAALAEGIGILSLLISLFGGTELDIITFGLVAALILVTNYPRRLAWEKTVDYFASNRTGSVRPG